MTVIAQSKAIRLALAASLIPFFLLSACSASFQRLRPTAEIPGLASLAEAARSLSRGQRLVEAGKISSGPIFLAVEDAGKGVSDRLVVMLHGVLSDRESWRFVAGDLGQDHNLMMIDLLGCGASSHPARAKQGDYGPTAQARYVLEALRQRLDGDSNQPNIALVGHSFGGAVILRMLGDAKLQRDFEGVLETVDRVVLLSPLDFAVEKIHPVLGRIATLGTIEVQLAAALGILQRIAVRSSLDGAVDRSKVTREDALRLYRIVRHRSTRRPAKAMIRQAVPFRPPNRPDWEQIEELVADYPNVTVPALILWGERDETLPVSMGYKLAAQLGGNVWLRVLEKSKHSLAIERPRMTADFIRRFVATGGEGWPSFERVEISDADSAQLEGPFAPLRSKAKPKLTEKNILTE